MDAREVNLTLDFCLKVGELLLSSGAGAADVTATMRALARHLGLRNADVDVTFINLNMAYQETPEDVPVLATRQVKQRTTDYEDLTRVDHLVRAVLRDDVDLRAARAELGRITSTGHARRRWAITGGLALMAAGVALQLGGGVPVVLLAAVAATIIDRLQLAMSRRRVPVFYQQIASAGVASLLAVAVSIPLDIEVSTAITANIVVLLAGLGFMGAIQDALTGFYITAGARITEVLLSTGGIIAGVSAGLGLARVVGLDLPPIEPASVSLRSVSGALLGAAVGAAAFAYASYGPRRSILPIAAIAAAAEAVTIGFPDEFGHTWAVGAAAFLVGVVSYSASGRFHVPPLVIVVPAVVPLLPGLSIYRGLTLLGAPGSEDASAGLLAMFGAASIAVALASGVILGEYVAQPLRREARRLENRLAGPRLVGPVSLRTRRQRRRRRAGVSDSSSA